MSRDRLVCSFPLLLFCLSLGCGPAAAQQPESMLFRFDRVAVFGPVDRSATVYPIDGGPQRRVGWTVHVRVDEGGEESFLVRMPLEAHKMPSHISTDRVRVVREAWMSWERVPSWRIGDALYVRIHRSEILAAVVAGGEEPRPGVTLFASVLTRFRSWLVREGGEPITGPLRRQLDVFARKAQVEAGEIFLVQPAQGPRARAIYLGVLQFFEHSDDSSGHAIAVGDAIYWLSEAQDRTAQAGVLAGALSRLLQQRRLQGLYVREWAEQWLGDLEGRALELAVQQQRETLLRELNAP